MRTTDEGMIRSLIALMKPLMVPLEIMSHSDRTADLFDEIDDSLCGLLE